MPLGVGIGPQHAPGGPGWGYQERSDGAQREDGGDALAQESTTKTMRGGKQKLGARQPIRHWYAGSLHLLRQRTREGAGEDQPVGGGNAGAIGVQ